MGKAASQPTVLCHSLRAQKSGPEAKRVSQLETQAGREEKQEESEQTTLSEAQSAVVQ